MSSLKCLDSVGAGEWVIVVVVNVPQGLGDGTTAVGLAPVEANYKSF